MVDVRASNEKLRARSRRIVSLATGASDAEIEAALAATDGEVKNAILTILGGVDGPTAARSSPTPAAICAPRCRLLAPPRPDRWAPPSLAQQGTRTMATTGSDKNQNQNANQNTTKNKNRATAAAILPLVGGAGNISSVAHCMTRLRLGLHDRSLVQEEALKALPAVLGVVEDDTYQIVLGPGHGRPGHPRVRGLGGRTTSPRSRAAGAGRSQGPGTATGAPGSATAVGAEELAAQGAAIKSGQEGEERHPVQALPAPDREHLRPADPRPHRLRHHRRTQRPADQPRLAPGPGPGTRRDRLRLHVADRGLRRLQHGEGVRRHPHPGRRGRRDHRLPRCREHRRLRPEARPRPGRRAGRPGRGAARRARREVVPQVGAGGARRPGHPDPDGPGRPAWSPSSA